MSGNIPALPPAAPATYLKPPALEKPALEKPALEKHAPEKPAPDNASAAGFAPRPAGHHPTPALSPTDISYVDSLMGIVPAQALEYILLKTGVPMPENLGNDIDTLA